MRLLTSVGGRSGKLNLRREDDRWTFSYQSEAGSSIVRDASVLEVEPGIYSILIDGKSYEVKVVTAPAGYYVDLDGERSVVEVQDPRAVSRRGLAGVRDGRQSVSARMPGRVVRVLVREGTEVEAGGGRVVVGPVETQNEMEAAKGGPVVSGHVIEGATVAGGGWPGSSWRAVAS